MIYFIFILLTFILYKGIYKIPIGYKNEVDSVVKARRNFTILSCLLLIIIISFKDISVGTDTVRYYYHFLYDGLPNWRDGNIAGEELGFRSLEYYCREFGFNWIEYSLLTSLIIVAPMGYFFYKYSDNIWASFFLYIAIGSFAHNMTALRQSLAAAMVLIATIALFNKKYHFFILFVFAGFLFHYSAIAALVLGIIPFIKYKNNFQLTILLLVPLLVKIAGNVLFSFIGVYLPERYDGYESQTYTMNPVLELMWLSILAFAWYSLIKNKNVSDKEFRLYLFTVFFVSSIELSEHVYAASRLSTYMGNVLITAIPCFIYKFPQSESRRIIAFGIYLLCMIAFILSLMGSDTLSISEYKFIDQKYL